MTDRRKTGGGLNWLKLILALAVVLAVFAGVEVIARQEAALPDPALSLRTELLIPADGKMERLILPPIATAVSADLLPVVARSRSSR